MGPYKGEYFCGNNFAYFSILLGHPNPKKMLIFRFVGIFEYIILLMLIIFLDMCQNSKGWMRSL